MGKVTYFVVFSLSFMKGLASAAGTLLSSLLKLIIGIALYSWINKPATIILAMIISALILIYLIAAPANPK